MSFYQLGLEVQCLAWGTTWSLNIVPLHATSIDLSLKTPFNRFGNKSLNIRRDAHSEPNAYLNLTQLFPPVLLPRFVACRSRVRCLQSALREVTLFVMDTSFTTDIVSTMCRMWQHCLSTLRTGTRHNEVRCKNIWKQLRNANYYSFEK